MHQQLPREPLLAALRRHLVRCWHSLRRLLKGEHAAPLTHRAAGDEFDARHGVATAGVTPLSTLRIAGASREGACDHIAIEPAEMAVALASLQLRPERFVFVDLGSGKGRASLIASRLPFIRIIGVEFAPALVEIAQRNAQTFRDPLQRCSDIQFLCADATQYELPSEPLVIFMYNPFFAELMAKMAARTALSLQRTPRECYVLYANPFYPEAWLEAGFTIEARGPAFLLLKGGTA